jgi:hypothetical protein
MEEANPQSEMQLPVDEDYCIQRDLLDLNFPGASSLKYKRPGSNRWYR